MRFVYKGKLMSLDDIILTRMSTKQLTQLEAYLWKWMDSTNVAVVIGAIHRELRWRAEDSEFRQGRHP